MITEITQWILDLIAKLFLAVWNFLADIVIEIVDLVLKAIATVIKGVPAPDFLTQYSLTSLFAMLPSDVLYFVGAFGMTQCFAVIAAGFAFRMLRKIVTLGQW